MHLLYPRGTSRTSKHEHPAEAMDFLHTHKNMAHLLPTITRLVALQKACTALLPTMFNDCEVLHFDAGNLLLSVANAALASKLKQQLPHIQTKLLQQGWQVNAIRIKVQVPLPKPVSNPLPKKHLPPQALAAFAQLNLALGNSPQNAALKAAVLALTKQQTIHPEASEML
jgi:hypothetical protein